MRSLVGVDKEEFRREKFRTGKFLENSQTTIINNHSND